MKNRTIALLLLTMLTSVFGCAHFQTSKQFAGANADTHEMYFGIARIAERNDKLESARRAYLEILERNPDHENALHRMAVTSVKLDRIDEAMTYFEQAMESDEPSAELIGDYGYALYLQGDEELAVTHLKRSLEMDPNDERTANNLAIVLGQKGDYDEAYRLFQQSGDRSAALANLAFVQSQSGDVKFAKQNYHRALEINPKLSVAASGLYEIHRAVPQERNDKFQSTTRLVKRKAKSSLSPDEFIQSISSSPRPRK